MNYMIDCYQKEKVLHINNSNQVKESMNTIPGTLNEGEVHPASHEAFKFVKEYLINDPVKGFRLLESFASCAIEGNRLGEVCGETLRRVMHGEAVSDRYLLGLAWILKSMDEDKR